MAGLEAPSFFSPLSNGLGQASSYRKMRRRQLFERSISESSQVSSCLRLYQSPNRFLQTEAFPVALQISGTRICRALVFWFRHCSEMGDSADLNLVGPGRIDERAEDSGAKFSLRNALPNPGQLSTRRRVVLRLLGNPGEWICRMVARETKRTQLLFPVSFTAKSNNRVSWSP